MPPRGAQEDPQTPSQQSPRRPRTPQLTPRRTRRPAPKPTLALTPHRHCGSPRRGHKRSKKNRHNIPSGFTKGMRAPMSMCVVSLCMYREDQFLAETV